MNHTLTADIVQLLLQKSVKVKGLAGVKEAETETSGPVMTPLHLACFSKNVQAVKMLLKAGADVEARFELIHNIINEMIIDTTSTLKWHEYMLSLNIGVERMDIRPLCWHVVITPTENRFSKYYFHTGVTLMQQMKKETLLYPSQVLVDNHTWPIW